jgi:lysophospholipase
MQMPLVKTLIDEIPIDETLIDETNYAGEMRGTVLPALARCRSEGWMEPAEADGLAPVPSPGKLHYLCYDAAEFGAVQGNAEAKSRGTVAIVHGFSEFAAKYSEMIWYFLCQGYSVCMLEHRGHGYSPRDIDDPALVWIDDYRRYIADLTQFVTTIGKQSADGRPLYLYSHSMGGGIGAIMVERYPAMFDKAVLSSPMIAPQTGMPTWLARPLMSLMCGIGQGKHVVFGQGGFPAEFSIEGEEAMSEARAHWYYDRRAENVHYHSNSATYGWVREALRMSREALRPSACERIETPTLLCQAGKDIWVLNEAQNRFVRQVQCAGGNLRMVRFADSAHNMFCMPNRALGPYLDTLFGFLGDSAQ